MAETAVAPEINDLGDELDEQATHVLDPGPRRVSGVAVRGDAERLRDIVQAAGSDAIDALLVFVGLLIGDADQLGHLLLGEPEHDPALAHAGADMAVDVLRT